MGGFKFEDNRQPWETGPHWELKREFMEKYCDMFEEDRLLCLAQAYSNIILMNCRYPDPVMIQISHLAKPLEMRKKFQGNTDSLETEEPNKRELPEKAKLIYEKSGKSFKQVKFCSSASSTEQVQPIKESSHSPSVSETFIQENPIVQSSPFHHTVTQPHAENISGKAFSNNESNIENINAEMGNTIIQCLGLDFIQSFVQKVRMFQVKFQGQTELLMSAAQCLKITAFLDFQYEFESTSKPGQLSQFTCKFSIKKCFIASGKATNKKKAKLNSIIHGLDVLTKLAICVSPSSSNKGNVENDSSLLDQTSNTLKKSIKVNQMEISEQERPKSIPLPEEDFRNLENLGKMWGNAIPDVSCVKAAASRLNILNLISFDRKITQGSDKKLNTWKLLYKNILISSGCETKLQDAKCAALSSAYLKIQNLKNCEILNNELCPKYSLGEVSLESEFVDSTAVITREISMENVPFTLNRSLFYSSINDCFALLDNLANPLKNIKNTLSESANFCKKTFGYNLEVIPGAELPQFKADVLIDNVPVGTGTSCTKETAKTIACENAVEMLRKKYYGIQVKRDYDDRFRITREHAFSNHASTNDALTDNNLGCRMLKMMGWTGGGLGSSGIAEPVGLDTTHNFGKGLGFAKQGDDNKVFKRQIHSMLKDFSKSESLSELLFSTDFSKDERKDIHQIAGRYGLHTASHGKDKERFIVIRRKYTVVEVLTYLEKVGGSDNKFQLVDASIDEQNPFKITGSI